MKKIFVTGLALLAALLLLALGALAELSASATLEGLITEVDDGYILMQDQALGTVRVNLDDVLTAYDGIAAKGKLTVGWYVFVMYDGALTRSQPPQATARKVGCYVVSGTVGDILPTGYTVKGDSVLGNVIIHADATLPTAYQGVPITVYYNGVMALSYPPQISASYLLVPVLDGTVSDAGTAGFTLTASDGQAYRVAVTDTTRMATLPAAGDSVRVYYNGEVSADHGVTALEVAPPTSANGEPATAAE